MNKVRVIIQIYQNNINVAAEPTKTNFFNALIRLIVHHRDESESLEEVLNRNMSIVNGITEKTWKNILDSLSKDEIMWIFNQQGINKTNILSIILGSSEGFKDTILFPVLDYIEKASIPGDRSQHNPEQKQMVDLLIKLCQKDMVGIRKKALTIIKNIGITLGDDENQQLNEFFETLVLEANPLELQEILNESIDLHGGFLKDKIQNKIAYNTRLLKMKHTRKNNKQNRYKGNRKHKR